MVPLPGISGIRVSVRPHFSPPPLFLVPGKIASSPPSLPCGIRSGNLVGFLDVRYNFHLFFFFFLFPAIFLVRYSCSEIFLFFSIIWPYLLAEKMESFFPFGISDFTVPLLGWDLIHYHSWCLCDEQQKSRSAVALAASRNARAVDLCRLPCRSSMVLSSRRHQPPLAPFSASLG